MNFKSITSHYRSWRNWAAACCFVCFFLVFGNQLRETISGEKFVLSFQDTFFSSEGGSIYGFIGYMLYAVSFGLLMVIYFVGNKEKLSKFWTHFCDITTDVCLIVSIVFVSMIPGLCKGNLIDSGVAASDINMIMDGCPISCLILGIAALILMIGASIMEFTYSPDPNEECYGMGLPRSDKEIEKDTKEAEISEEKEENTQNLQ